MQELMNSTIHQWSHSWYRSKYCPSLIVQDSGDTTINGTVPIYFRASPDLCHHFGRGINPCGRAVIGPLYLEKRWLSLTLHRLPRPQPNLQERPVSTSTHFRPLRRTTKSTDLYQD